jgi:hypothetical protein
MLSLNHAWCMKHLGTRIAAAPGGVTDEAWANARLRVPGRPGLSAAGSRGCLSWGSHMTATGRRSRIFWAIFLAACSVPPYQCRPRSSNSSPWTPPNSASCARRTARPAPGGRTGTGRRHRPLPRARHRAAVTRDLLRPRPPATAADRQPGLHRGDRSRPPQPGRQLTGRRATGRHARGRSRPPRR